MNELTKARETMAAVMFRQHVVRTTEDRPATHAVLDSMLDQLDAHGGAVHLLYVNQQISEGHGVVLMPKPVVLEAAANESERGDVETETLDLIKGTDYVDLPGDVSVSSV